MKFPYEDYCYILDEGGRYQSLFGDPVKRVNRHVNKAEKKKLREKWGRHDVTFESDVRPEMRVLIDYYKHSDQPSDVENILWFDIEVSTDPEYPDPQVAQNEVTSIAVYDGGSDTKFVLLLDPDMDSFKYEDVIVRTYAEEENLLADFLEAWKKIDPTIVVGYNSDYFDIPYTYNRLKRLFGEDVADQLSPIGEVDWDDRKERFYIAGVSSLDYLQIYKNFTFSELSSYSLDNVAKEELDKGKVPYKGREYVPTGGGYTHVSEYDGEPEETVEVRDLDDLKEYDPGRFVRYNMEDVMLLVDIDAKRDFIQLTRKICHMGHVPYEDIYNSSRFIDGAALTRLAKKGIAAPDCKYYDLSIDGTHPIGEDVIETEDEIPDYVPYKGTLRIWKTKSTAREVPYHAREGNKFMLDEELDFNVTGDMDLTLHYKGAYVKEPNGPGRHEWVYDLDLTSMYPSIIMSINISPETKVGRVYDWDAEKVADGGGKDKYEVYIFQNDSLHEFPREGLIRMLRDKGFSIASNGVFYRNDRRGVIPRILEEWYEERNRFKELRNDWREKEGEEGEEKADYFDNMQHVHKILINCFTPDHQVLTKSGAKDIEDVEEGEQVYSVDPDTGEATFKPVTRTYRQDRYEGKIAEFSNTYVDFAVTPNHDMVFEGGKEKAYNALSDAQRRRIPIHDPVETGGDRTHVSLREECDRLGIEYKYDPENDRIKEKRQQAQWIDNTYSLARFLRFCGWYVSEGSLSATDRKEYEDGRVRGVSRRINIANETPKHRQSISELLEAMNLRHHTGDRSFTVSNTLLYEILRRDFGEGSYEKRLPRWTWDLDGSVAKNLLRAMFKGDGDERGTRYSTVSEDLAHDFVQLAFHCGHRARIRGKDDGCFRIALYDRGRGVSPTVKDEHREHVDYEGPIVCLEVADNHTVLAGRSGNFNWTGQSVYGVLGLPTFRFYDIDNAMAVTETGRALIGFSEDMGNKYYNDELGTAEDWCVYTDTDEKLTFRGDQRVPVERDGERLEVFPSQIKEGDIIFYE